MKIFWSWQSDTDGDTGRFFVRDCLKAAIKILKLSDEIEDRPERELRGSLEIDQGSQGVVGHPGLADTIFGKIDAADVFVADVTLVAEVNTKPTDDNPAGIKRLINSNVAIEYGYAVKALTDDAILMVMNLHYGPLTKLPFDLSHKVGPRRYRLAENASPAEIATAKKALTSEFVKALRLHIGRVALQNPVVPFNRLPSKANQAFFWDTGEIIAYNRLPHFSAARFGEDAVTIPYYFQEHHAFYLRLIPSRPIPELSITRLKEIVDSGEVPVLSRLGRGNLSARNTYGAICYETHGDLTTPTAFTQLHQNGEIWGVSREFVMIDNQGSATILMQNFANALGAVLPRYVDISTHHLGNHLPYTVEIGAVGLSQVRLTLPGTRNRFPQEASEMVHRPSIGFIDELTTSDEDDIRRVVMEFMRKFYDLAGIRIKQYFTDK